MRRSSRISNGAGPAGSDGGGTTAGEGGGGGGGEGGGDASSSRVSRSAARRAEAAGSAAASAAEAPVPGSRGTKRKSTANGSSGGTKSAGARKGKAEEESDADDDNTTDESETTDQSKKKRARETTGRPRQSRKAGTFKILKGKGKAVASSSETSSSEEEEEEPPTAKAKNSRKLMKGKFADWREFEKPTTLKFEKLPLEVWNQIISVDSDLDLRDHLALAGTCRYLRSCYTDLIWHILFAAHDPQVGHLDYRNIEVSSQGYIDPTSFIKASGSGWFYSDVQVGPHRRGWAPARGIATSGTAERTVGSRWGATREEWEAGEPERLAQTQEAKAAIIATCGRRFRTYDRARAQMEVMRGYLDFAVFDELTEEEKKRYPDHASDERQAVRRTRRREKQEFFEPFPSPWRDLVVKAVNRPTIASTLIKWRFKLTSNEVKQLLSFAGVDEKKKGGRCRLAAVQSFAYKLHGGPTGHADFLLKTKQKADKAEETRLKNDHLAWAAATAEAQSAQSFDADALPLDVDDDEMAWF